MTVIVYLANGAIKEHTYVDSIAVHDNYLRVQMGSNITRENYCYTFFAMERWEERD
jgi:hypothetical protein